MKKIMGLLLAAVLVVTALPLSSVNAEDTAATNTTVSGEYQVNGSGYQISHKAGKYVGTVELSIRAKKGYKVYYSTSSPIPVKNRILSKKSKTIKIKKNTTVCVIAVKSKARVNQAWLNLAAGSYKRYKYTITNEISFDGTNIKSTNSNGVTIKNSASVSTVDINKSGTYYLTGSGSNVRITVNKKNKSIKKVVLVLDSLSITNGELTDDNPVLYIGKNTKAVEIKLSGSSTLSGPGTFSSSPAKGIIYDASTGYVRISRQSKTDEPSLTITDGISADTVFGDKSPSAGIYAVGKILVKNGSVTVSSNGSSMYSKKSNVSVSGGELSLSSEFSSGLKAGKGSVTVTGGDIKVTKTAFDGFAAPTGTVKITAGTVTMTGIGGDGIEGKLVNITGGTTSITTAYEYGATDFYDQGMGAARHNTRSSSTAQKVTTTTEYINYNTGSHAGICAGKEGMTYSIKTGGSGVSAATGGLTISGGKVAIDTLATGTLANNLSATGYVAAEPGLYIIGAPSPGIKSYGTVSITGGVHTIAAAGNGLESDGDMIISKDSDITVTQAYNGLEAPYIVIGTKDTVNDTTQVKLYTSGDGIHGYSVSKDYVYEDSTLEKYKKTSVTSKDNSITIYSGYVNVMIDSAKSITGKGAGVLAGNNSTTSTSSASGTQSFLPNGNGINCDGNIDLMGGATVIYGPHEGKKGPFYFTGKFKISSGATVLAMGVDGGNNSKPNVEGQAFIEGTIPQASSGSSSSTTGSTTTTTTTTKATPAIKSGDAVGIMSSSNTIIGIKPPKDVNYILYSSGTLKTSSYDIFTGGELSGAINSYSYDGRYQTYTEKSSGSSSSSSGTSGSTTTGPTPRVTLRGKTK